MSNTCKLQPKVENMVYKIDLNSVINSMDKELRNIQLKTTDLMFNLNTIKKYIKKIIKTEGII